MCVKVLVLEKAYPSITFRVDGSLILVSTALSLKQELPNPVMIAGLLPKIGVDKSNSLDVPTTLVTIFSKNTPSSPRGFSFTENT